MKKYGLMVASLLLCCAMPAEGQLLRQLGKELKKVAEDKGKEVVEQLTKSDSPEKKQPSGAVNATKSDPNFKPQTIEIDEATYHYIRLTDDTKFIRIPELLDFAEMHDGMFGVKNESGRWAFFNAEGEMVFGFDWNNPTMKNANVRFENGAVIMKSAKSEGSNYPYYILYKDGSCKKLPTTYLNPTPFSDGLARVLKKTTGTVSSQGVWVYINTEGKEVFPNLNEPVKYSFTPIERVGRIGDGLRAHYDTDKKLWGYIDTKGNMVIEPAYFEAGDFNEGRAVVVTREGWDKKWHIIDTQGKDVFGRSFTSFVSGCSDGRIVVHNDEKKQDEVYDRDGKLLKTFEVATPFVRGFSWVKEKEGNEAGYLGASNKMIVVDENFNKVNDLPFNTIYRNATDQYGFKVGDAGVFTLSVNSVPQIYMPDGRLVISGRTTGEVEAFSSDFMAKADMAPFDNGYCGFINEKGEFELVLKSEVTAGRVPSVVGGNPDTTPGETVEVEWKEPPSPPTPPAGKPWSEPVYTVTAVADPAEGGTVTGSGEYKYGDQVEVVASPSEGWKLGTIESDTYVTNLSDNAVRATVRGRDLNFTAKFIKEDELLEPRPLTASGKGSYGNTDSKVEWDVYLLQSNEKNVSSPYGNATYGYLTAIFDSEQLYAFEMDELKDVGQIYAKFCFVPMLISGRIVDGEKEYIVADGGQFMVGGLNAKINDPLMNLYLSFLISYNGASHATVSDARYRIEVQSRDEATGACTLGRLERYHPSYGWLPSDNDAFKPSGSGGFALLPKTNKNASIPTFIFQGIRLTPCDVRNDVTWAPPAGWFADQKEYDDATTKLMESISTFIERFEQF